MKFVWMVFFKLYSKETWKLYWFSFGEDKIAAPPTPNLQNDNIISTISEMKA